MKKWIVLILLLCSIANAADQVRVMDKTGREVNPGASNRWPVSHLNAAVAGVKMMLSAPGNTRSHYVTGFVMTGGAAADGFHLLRQNALFFDTTDTLTMADHSTDFDWGTKAANGDFTAEFWINQEATAAAIPNLMTRGDEASDGWNIETTAASLLKFTIHDSSDTQTITATTAIDDGEWHHVICQVDRDSTTGMQIYVDGEADATAKDPTSVVLTMDGGTTVVMTGVASETIFISTVGLYIGSTSGALTASEIRTRYNTGIGLKYEGDETGLQVGFNTDEGIGTACHDIKNDASNVVTLSGTAWVPSRQNGATAEINEAGVPFSLQDMMRSVGKFQCGIGTNFGGVPVTFPHPIKIGRNNPLSILETDGAFDLIIFGYTAPVR